jgi:murein DD-endopeptidase MepM/ murein hydrolase activator NlpD
MKPPFALVVVHGDGSRVTRLSVPRWLAYGALGVHAVVLVASVGFSGHDALLQRQVDSLRRSADDERTLLDSLQTRLSAAGDAFAGWKALHAKIWKAFAPDTDVPVGDDGGPRLRDLKRLVSETSRMVNALPLRWPIRGPVNSGFGLRRSPWTGKPEQHHGIDIGSPPGTPVRSPVAGTVVAASTHGRLGKHVALDHGNGVTSLYGHLEALDVKNGERVERGQVIGLVGNTGRSTGPHLHYELLVDGKPVDPRGFLQR